MNSDDALAKRGRALEEDYFRRKDQELIAKIRTEAAAQQSQQALEASSGITDPLLLQELAALGFTPATVSLLPMVPLLQVAWAEGGVTAAERDLILKLAEARGIGVGTAADAQLMEWLANRPADQVFSGALRLINAMLDSGAETASTLDVNGLVEYAEQIAAASGGVFGLGRVSSEERALIGSIAASLRGRS